LHSEEPAFESALIQRYD